MNNKNYDFNQLATKIKVWAKQLGFSQIGITDTNLSDAEKNLQQWLGKNFHGDMNYMQKQNRAITFEPKTIICCAINYFPNCSNCTYISRYALGRDYHKLIRKRLHKLVQKIIEEIGTFNYRCFVDNASVLEKALAVKAGLGWHGKNSLLINHDYGSWCFLGEIYTDLLLPIDKPQNNYCGNCAACINACPTGAIIAPFQIDARRCISYLTIEYRGYIPLNLRPLIGTHVYGCDECQLACPWNSCAKITYEQDFQSRHNLDHADLIELFSWSEQEFLTKTEGSAIRRIGYECWLRNIAVALGNTSKNPKILKALKSRLNHPSALVREHVNWSLTDSSKAGS